MSTLTPAERLSDLYGITVQEAARLLEMAEGDAQRVELVLVEVFGQRPVATELAQAAQGAVQQGGRQ